MVLQKIYVQYGYQYSGYFLPDAEIYVCDTLSSGAIFDELCYSAFDGISTGCGFNLTEGVDYDVFSGKAGYKPNGDWSLIGFTAPVNPYILLWLYPCEPTVVTHDVTWVSATEADLSGEVTDMDGLSRVFAGFQYGKVGEPYTQGDEWPSDYPEAIWDYLSGLTPGTTYNFRARVSNRTDEDTFYVFGETKQFTTSAVLTYDMHIILPNANGKLFLSNTITTCDDPAKACTEFRFQIRNDGNVAMAAWYKVSVVGGATLYDSTTASLNPGAASVVIDDTVCALIPGGLPVGTHTIKVETGPEGLAATDSYTEPLYVIEEQVIEPPEVVAMDASGVTQSSAIPNANLTYTGDVSTHIGFEYGKTTSYGTTIWDKYTSTTGHYEKEVTGLEANTTYHFRPIVTNENGTGYGTDKTFTTLEAAVDTMHIVLPNANGKLFLSNTIIACDDYTKACTEFRFQIRNDGNVAKSAWYKVSVVGGATLYDSTTASLNPGATSVVIDDTVCALIPGGLPVGTHTIKVETGPEGLAATDSYTEPLYVIEEQVIEPPSGVDIEALHYENRCGAEIADNCVWFYCYVEHFGGANTCTVYAEYKSEGDPEWSQTDPTVVPYDPGYDEGGFQHGPVTICIPNCEVNHYIRTVASNDGGAAYSAIQTPITVRLEAPTEITQTSVKLNAYIVSMGSVSTGIANFKYGTPSPTTYDTPPISIYSAGAISRTITGLEPNTTYQYYLFARVTSPQAYPQTTSATVSFTTLGMADPPEVVAMDASGVTQSSAILNANLTYTGDVSTHIGFEYGKTTSYGTTIWDKYTSTTGHYEKGATGLETNTTYHFRPIVTNENGTGYGADKTFTTSPPAIPEVSTWDALSITQTSAKLVGKVYISDGQSTHYGFEYGKTTSYGTIVWLGFATWDTTYSTTVEGLDPDTLYHYRAIGTNDDGTGHGADKTFTTLAELAELPEVTTYSISNITPTSAYVVANLIDSNDIITQVGFEYGETTSYGSILWYGPMQQTPMLCGKPLEGLTQNTLYHFRAFATNGNGTGYGADMTFTTSPLAVPEMETNWVMNITQTSAKLGGKAYTSGGTRTHYGIEYGKTTSYGTIVWVGYATWAIPYSTTVEGLDPDTLYHFRAIGENDGGTGYGADMTFTTLPAAYDITFVATAPGISDLHNVDVNDVTDPWSPKYLGKT